MARVSKKVSAAQREAENAQHRIWKTAIYARLSDFDDVLRNLQTPGNGASAQRLQKWFCKSDFLADKGLSCSEHL